MLSSAYKGVHFIIFYKFIHWYFMHLFICRTFHIRKVLKNEKQGQKNWEKWSFLGERVSELKADRTSRVFCDQLIIDATTVGPAFQSILQCAISEAGGTYTAV